MGSNTTGPYSPTSTAPVDTQLAGTTSGCIFIHNLSQYELFVTTPDALFKSFVAAWGWRRIDVKDPMPMISWMVAATPAQTNPPLSAVFVESYELREEAPPQYFGQYQRQTSVGGGNVTTNQAYQLFEPGNTDWFSAVAAAFGGGQALYLLANPPANVGHLAGLGMALQYMAAGGGSGIPTTVLGVDNTTGLLSIMLKLAAIGGENVAAGAIGVPVVDGLTQAQHVTVTTQVTVLSFTPTITGTYRISCYARIVNGVSPNNVKFQALYNDPDAVGATTISLLSALSGGFFSGSNAVANGGHPMVPIEVRHTGGQVLSIIYQDPTNTPGDFVTAHVERIA